MSLDVKLTALKPTTVFDWNITHNLNTMAQEAGVYEYLWRPDELGITKAGELIEPLTIGLQYIKDNEDMLKEYNPKNGWGHYEGLLRFVENYLQACIDNPDAEISISR